MMTLKIYKHRTNKYINIGKYINIEEQINIKVEEPKGGINQEAQETWLKHKQNNKALLKKTSQVTLTLRHPT